MRVNMDSSVVSDPRFGLIARDLGVARREVYGSCYLIWLCCYERRSALLSSEEIDLACELDGMAAAMVARGIAHNEGGKISIHGIPARIKFLEEQAEKGRESGRVRREKKRNEPHAEHMLNQCSPGGSTYPLAPTPAACSDSGSKPILLEETEIPAPAKKPRSPRKPAGEPLPGEEEVIAYFLARPEQAKTPEPSKKGTARKYLRERLKQGYSVEDLKTVIDRTHSDDWCLSTGNITPQFCMSEGNVTKQLAKRNTHAQAWKKPDCHTGKITQADIDAQEARNAERAKLDEECKQSEAAFKAKWGTDMGRMTYLAGKVFPIQRDDEWLRVNTLMGDEGVKIDG